MCKRFVSITAAKSKSGMKPIATPVKPVWPKHKAEENLPDGLAFNTFNSGLSNPNPLLDFLFCKSGRRYDDMDGRLVNCTGPFEEEKTMAGKIMLSVVAQQVHVAFFLTNCHTCYYGGNQISKFFKLSPPTLVEYFGYQ